MAMNDKQKQYSRGAQRSGARLFASLLNDVC